MSLRGKLFAAVYDPMMKAVEQAGMGERRERLLASARGRVLEVGAGTGANLAHYGPEVESLTLAEPEGPMVRRLNAKAAERGAEVVTAPAEKLPFEDASFDTVVCTLVLCTVTDPVAAVREMRRVLRPTGTLLFIEHVRSSDDARLARRQDRMNRFNRFVAYGCNCNRDTVDTIRGAGFRVDDVERGDLDKAPGWLRPLVIGSATPVAG